MEAFSTDVGCRYDISQWVVWHLCYCGSNGDICMIRRLLHLLQGREAYMAQRPPDFSKFRRLP